MIMGLTSLQVCMDSCSSDWLQGTIQDESSSPPGEMLTCSRPLMERRLRPQQEQALKCPRCDSTHTKFCYYNNYSLSQPRYFCKTCRRYWTKGGTLRNIPVGGGCRKNKKLSNKKGNDPQNLGTNNSNNPGTSSHNNNPTDLHLSFPEMQMPPHFNNILAANAFAESKYNNLPLDFMETKLEALVGSSSCNYDFMGSGFGAGMAPTLHGFCSPYGIGMSFDGSAGNFVDSCERAMLPYDAAEQDQANEVNAIDFKPNPKMLSLEWHDHGCSDAGKDGTFGYSLNSLGSWTGMINGYGSSTSNR